SGKGVNGLRCLGHTPLGVLSQDAEPLGARRRTPAFLPGLILSRVRGALEPPFRSVTESPAPLFRSWTPPFSVPESGAQVPFFRWYRFDLPRPPPSLRPRQRPPQRLRATQSESPSRSKARRQLRRSVCSSLAKRSIDGHAIPC